MGSLKIRFIFNPRSGHNARNPYLFHRAQAFINEHRLDAKVVSTEHPRHATDLARRAIDEGCTLIAAIGGDGTMNEVATALVRTHATLGLIPCGSGNGLGRHLGIPNPGRGAFRALLEGTPRLIDTATANGQPFFNAMGLGFDAEISQRFTQVTRRGFGAYVRTTFSALRSFKPEKIRIHHNGEVLATDAFIMAVANSDQYGNNCYIAPGARVDDSLLNLTVLKPVGLFGAVPIAIRLFTRSIAGSRHALCLKAPRFTIERETGELIHTDGEPLKTARTIEVAVIPRSLRILTPRPL